MDWRRQWWQPALIAGGFLACFHLPVDWLAGRFHLHYAFLEALHLVRWYAREHVIFCLLPAFFIAGAIGAFVSQGSVMKYLGARANKTLAYGVASVSGTILAVCSCTVLPLFAGIYRMGAGLGPASAFLYSGPAINVLAVIMTARVLGAGLGGARAAGAIVFAVVIGLAMHFIFRREEAGRVNAQAHMPEPEASRPLWQNALFFALLVGVLVFANWSRPEAPGGARHALYLAKWFITGGLAIALGVILVHWFGLPRRKILVTGVATALLAAVFGREPMIPFAAAMIGLSWATSTEQGEGAEWFSQSWRFAGQILPLLLGGVFVAGLLLGRPGHEGLVPSAWVEGAVGGNSPGANFFASLAGAFMYFATLTEVPILQGLIGSGMGNGPALALLLAGPALSLPSMIVIRSVMGTKKTVVFISLVVVMATVTGVIYGFFRG